MTLKTYSRDLHKVTQTAFEATMKKEAQKTFNAIQMTKTDETC